MAKPKDEFRIEPVPPMRRFAMDAGYLGRRRHIVHGLIEVDVTEARQLIDQHQQSSGEKISFTAFIIYCLAQAIEEHPHAHAYRDWRNRLVIYQAVNITTMVETEFNARKVPIPHVFRSASSMSLYELHRELREVQSSPQSSDGARFMRWFLVLPAFVRRTFYWMVMRFPRTFRKQSSPVMVTAVGMFGQGGGWAITLPNFTLTVALGGISEKPAVFQGKIAVRDILDLTVSIDHDVVDGAPAARFVNSLRTRLESADGLHDL